MLKFSDLMVQWLGVLKLSRPELLSEGPTQAEAKAVGEHFEYWKQLVEDGTAFVVGRTQTTTPDTMGLAIFKALNEDAARSLAEADPAVVAGVFSLQLYPYFVALAGDSERFRAI